ncbi:deoxynucleoside kinase [Mycoplasma todarodis]|uniref:deoxynucleoside kinase n=1 Tax=Mycoplasma todarodis TaxID=1937191 RepID=UPI003B32755E
MDKKYANLIVVGGPVAVGKSTLVASLGHPYVDELIEGNVVQEEILKGTYSGDRVSTEVVQLFFAKRREQMWKKFAFADELHVLDRSIFETEIFARAKLKEKRYDLFEEYLDKTIKFLLEEYGYPKKYIVLTCSWEVFKERIFTRNRKVEINSFKENEEFWKEHIQTYETIMKKIFNRYDIDSAFIDTDKMNQEQVKEATDAILKEAKII